MAVKTKILRPWPGLEDYITDDDDDDDNDDDDDDDDSAVLMLARNITALGYQHVRYTSTSSETRSSVSSATTTSCVTVMTSGRI